MEASISVNANKLLGGLNSFIKSVDDFKKPIRDSLDILKNEQQQNFAQQGAIYQGGGFIRLPGQRATTVGKSWAPLAKSTQADRVRQGYRAKRPILVRSGRLQKGFYAQTSGKSSGLIRNVVPYAKYHQSGTDKMPARRIIGLSKKSDAAIRLTFVNDIKAKIKKAGL